MISCTFHVAEIDIAGLPTLLDSGDLFVPLSYRLVSSTSIKYLPGRTDQSQACLVAVILFHDGIQLPCDAATNLYKGLL